MRASWSDEYRVWNQSLIPVHDIRVPVSEVWTPAFFLANCVGRDCNVVPNNRSTLVVCCPRRHSINHVRDYKSFIIINQKNNP